MPRDQELIDLANRAFPRRSNLPVLICDIESKGGKLHDSTVGDLEKWWKTKPDNVTVRWIHVPLGLGLLCSSIEDMFLYDEDRGKTFTRAGSGTFPYLNVDCLHFRQTSDLEHLRDVYELLQPFSSVREMLDKSCFEEDQNESLQSDLQWRRKLFGLHEQADFWRLAEADVPLELSECIVNSDDGPMRPIKSVKVPLDRSGLTAVKHFADAHLVAAPFRCFHRADGILLTMSAATGIDYLHRDFGSQLNEVQFDRLTNPHSSVVGNIRSCALREGTSKWHYNTVEWFVVYLVTEIASLPSNTRSGRCSVSLLGALQRQVQELRYRRYERWQPQKTLDLVEAYLACADQLQALSILVGRKLAFLKRLQEDVRDPSFAEPKLEVHNEKASTTERRVDWAIRHVTGDKAKIDDLLTDLTQAMNGLFHMRNIEQNEVTLTSDFLNRAVLVFTGITTVFLPLSFFTSYYGMNLQGIMNTDKGERYFWKVCGSATVAIVVFISLCVLRSSTLARFLRLATPRILRL